MAIAGQIIFIMLAIISMGLGALFLIASVRSGARIVPAFVLMAAGAGFAYLAILIRKSAKLHDPEVIEQKILQIAERYGGKVPESALAQTGSPKSIYMPVIEKLEREGKCRIEIAPGGKLCVFDPLVHKFSKKCPYCGAEFPIKSDLRKCPNCGGDLEIKK